MSTSRLLLTALAAVGAASAAESLVVQAASKLEEKAALAPQSLALEFRLRGAQALKERDPGLYRKLLESTLGELRGSKDWALGPGALQALVALSPTEAVALLPNLRAGSAQMMLGVLTRANHPNEALGGLFRERPRASLPNRWSRRRRSGWR